MPACRLDDAGVAFAALDQLADWPATAKVLARMVGSAVATTGGLAYFGRMRKLSLAAALILLLGFTSTAEAKAPPKGKYDCVIGSGSLLFGSIKIQGGGKYRYSRFGKSGKFVAGKKLRKFGGTASGGGALGYSIRFRGGGLNKYKGYWFTSTTGTHEIALENPKNGVVSIYCDD